MNTQCKRSLSFILFSLLCCAASYGGISPTKFNNFKIGFLRTNPANLESSTSPEAGWTPIFDMKVIALRGEISVFSAKRSTNSKFFISDYEVFVMLPIFNLVTVEAGGGIQNWHGQEGVSPVATGGMMLRIGEFIDRLYVNYSRVFVKNNAANEFKVGLGFNL